MASDSYAALRRAVLDKHQVRFGYADTRWTACPHVLGWEGDGREHVLAYVMRCDSSPRAIGDWRCFDVEHVDDVRDNGFGWVTSRDGMPERCVQQVDVQAAATPGPRGAGQATNGSAKLERSGAEAGADWRAELDARLRKLQATADQVIAQTRLACQTARANIARAQQLAADFNCQVAA